MVATIVSEGASFHQSFQTNHMPMLHKNYGSEMLLFFLTSLAPILAEMAIFSFVVAFQCGRSMWYSFLMYHAIQSPKWPSVHATILNSQVVKRRKNFAVCIKYHYQINSKSYHGSRVKFSLDLIKHKMPTEEEALDIIKKYPIGHSLSVHVHPRWHWFSVIEAGSESILSFAIFF